MAFDQEKIKELYPGAIMYEAMKNPFLQDDLF